MKLRSKYHVKAYVAQLGGQSKLYEGDVVARSIKDAYARFGYVVNTTKMGLSSSDKVTVKPVILSVCIKFRIFIILMKILYIFWQQAN